MSKPLKVRVNLTVEVDPEVWELEYGVGATERAELRQDVAAYCFSCIADSAAANVGAMKVVH